MLRDVYDYLLPIMYNFGITLQNDPRSLTRIANTIILTNHNLFFSFLVKETTLDEVILKGSGLVASCAMPR